MPVNLPSIRDIFPGHASGFTKENLEKSPEIQQKLDSEVKQTLEYIDRGDLGIPSHALRAASFQYSNQCNEVNKEFMLCKKEEGDPRKCLKYNVAVSDCAGEFFRKVTDACADTFVAFSSCLERSQYRRIAYCRAEQLAFDTCLYEKLGFDKPRHSMEYGTTVKTDRPKPKNPYNFQPTFDTRNYPSPDFFSKPIGKTRDED